jgi:hypothetical protein
MATEELTFALNLEGGLARTAKDDASALEELKGSMDANMQSLREMHAAYRNLKGSATASTETMKSLKDRIAATKATLAGQTQQLVGMKGAFEKLPKPADGTAGALSRMLDGVSAAKGPLGGLVDRMSNLKGMLAAGGVAGAVTMLVTGLVELAKAAVTAAVALGQFVLASADARRSQLLQLEGLSKHRNYWLEMVTGQRRAADSAKFLQSAIDDVSSSTPLARSRIAEMQSELYRSGLRAGNLKAALEGLAIVESAQGQEAAQAFKASMLGASLYGSSIKKLSDDAKKRLGGVVKAQMLSLDVQSRKLKENLALLFSGVKLEPLLQQMSDLLSMFSQSTATGRALKVLLEQLISPLIGAVSNAGPILKKFFQGMMIAALLTAIAVLKLRNSLRDAFGGSELLSNASLMNNALQAGIFLFSMLAGMVATVAIGFGVLVGAVAAAAYGIYKLAEPFIWAVQKGGELVAWLVGTDWIGLGKNVVSGIANGITSGFGLVRDAMTNLGGEIMGAFQKRLDMHSPSRLAAEVSFNVPRGVRVGLEAGRPMVRTSAERLGRATEEGMRAGTERASTRGESSARVPTPQAAGAGAGASSNAAVPAVSRSADPRSASPRGPTNVYITFGDINATSGDASELTLKIRRGIEQALEGASIHAG